MRQINYRTERRATRVARPVTPIKTIKTKTKVLRATFSKKYYEIGETYNRHQDKYYFNILDKKTKRVILFNLNPDNLGEDVLTNKKHFHLYNLPQMYMSKGLVGISFKWIEE